MKLYTPQQQAAEALIRQYPNASARTLARAAVDQHPGMWPSVNAARMCVLRFLGQQSGANKPDSPYKREPRKPGEWLDKIPPATPEYDTEWGAVEYAGPLRVLVLADMHTPWHDETAVRAAIRYGVDHGADFVLLNGDTFDTYGPTRWVKMPTTAVHHDYGEEIAIGRQMISAVRAAFPDAKIVMKEGNHEERLPRYLATNAPALYGLEAFTIESVYRLGADHGIEWVGEKRPIHLGKLPVIHGHEFGFAYSPVNPAKAFFNRALTHVLASDRHQTSQHSVKAMDGNVISSWSTGCLCYLHPRYRPLNNWNHGFAFVEIDEAGAFRVENLRIVDGKAW